MLLLKFHFGFIFQTSTLSGKSVMRLISKVGDSLSTMTLKMEETDEW